ncbi:MAG: tRNA (adenosine(37)-N6)-threonylcarbamoyltransferase complex transferase subunit TsaD [Leptospiraceae bacterium]|nr:tRNA (adenosine(37)-N6)-threonylcarbamoyltransferase complex transferase subunit TsaD [Leptospiraceae bacterium]
MIVLGIETSCDETSVAVVRDGRECLANVIHSQIGDHAPYRGVVPEIASRQHLEKINSVYARALELADIPAAELDCVAVTNRPGLVGSLMIGAQLARSVALVHDLPIVAVDHLEAHLYAPCLEGWQPRYPFLGLLLSGGNSAIYRVEAPARLSVLADTMDDACGEAYDKIASVLGLAYPGGPAIEACARRYHSENEAEAAGRATQEPSLFGRLLKNMPRERMAFSFSGIKTAVLRLGAELDGLDADERGRWLPRICHDFQWTVAELIERNLSRAVQHTGIDTVVASGGVLANEFLRNRLKLLANDNGFQLIYPQKKIHCTDNAGMVAALAYYLYRAYGPQAFAGFDFAVSSRRLSGAANPD